MEIIRNEVGGGMPTHREIRSGKQDLERLLRQGDIAPHEVAYIAAATDPYHDTALSELLGAPDLYTGKSVVETIPVSITASSPYGPGTGSYNIRVVTNPIMGSQQCVRANRFDSQVQLQTASPGNIVTVSSLDVDFFLGATGNFSDYPVNPLHGTLPPDVLDGSVKVLGCGLEIVDTTPELYKGGITYAARTPQLLIQQGDTTTLLDPAATVTANVTCNGLLAAPTTVSELMTYPNATKWEAKFGLYSVIEQYDVAASTSVGGQHLLRYTSQLPNDNGDASGALYGYPVDAPNCTILTPARTGFSVDRYAAVDSVHIAPSDSVVVMMMGLNENATFNIRLKYFIERRVNSSITSLLPLVPFARESPSFNPKVLELVSRIWHDLPVAVKYGENPAGEFWDRILSAIGALAPVVGLIPHPAAKAISAVASSAALAGKTYNNSRKRTVEAAPAPRKPRAVKATLPQPAVKQAPQKPVQQTARKPAPRPARR